MLSRAHRRYLRSLSTIGNSRHFIYLAGILLLLWLANHLQYFSSSGDPIERSIMLHRWADRELHLSDAYAKHPAAIRWIMGADTTEETRKEVVRLYKEYRERDLLDEDAQCSEALIHYVLGNEQKAKDSIPSADDSYYTELTAAIIYKKDLTEHIENCQVDLSQRELSWWERKALQNVYTKDTAPEVIADDLFNTEKQNRIKSHTLWSSIPYWAALFIGLPFLRSFFRSNAVLPKELHHFTKTYWPIFLVLLVYIISDFLNSSLQLGDNNYSLSFLASVFAEGYIGEQAGLIVFDIVFRLGNALILIIIFAFGWKFLKRLFGLQKGIQWKLIFAALSLDFLIAWAIAYVTELFVPIDYPSFLSSSEDGWSGLSLILLSGVVLAPLGEEIVYRGFIFRSFRNYMPFVFAALLSGAIFSIVHYYDLSGTLTMVSFTFVTAWLYQKTGNLMNCILLHALTNLLIIAPNWLLYNYQF